MRGLTGLNSAAGLTRAVQGGWSGLGFNNIDADPLFVDPLNGDFRVSPSSPCIDAGDNTAVPLEISTDLDGNARFVDDPATADTGNGVCHVDMGAYEFQQGAVTCCLGDLNGDGGVEMADLQTLIAQWRTNPGGPPDFTVMALWLYRTCWHSWPSGGRVSNS